jgi:two-component system phosphate regulon response regulator PhoB
MSQTEPKILLVEDSKEIYQLVKVALAPTFNVCWEKNLTDGEKFIEENQLDLLILDIELPDGNGVDLCSRISSTNPHLPIFFLTAHDTTSEKVLGFSAGADDFITKPFNSLVFKARVEAKLKKQHLLNAQNNILSWKEMSINTSGQTITLNLGDKTEELELTALEYKLLMYFANNCEKVLSRDEILSEIWGDDIHVYSRSVDTHVSKLRKKLGDHGELIESVHGVGYKFMPTPA